jgi:hypothetical protein
MRELIERFTYRLQLWQRERYDDYSPADPTALRNPLRFVAVLAVMSIILDATEPFVFHRAFDMVPFVRIAVALAFLILYQSKSQYAWHLVIAWVPFAFFGYWILRFTGYSLYQPRVHSSLAYVIFGMLHLGISLGIFVWLVRIREHYFRYIQDAQ